jgi:hypothetical protein
VFVVPLLVVAALALIVAPVMCVVLAVLFGLAWLQQRSDRAGQG